MENTNLVELVKHVFNQDIINQAATQLHEDKNNVAKALDSMIPATLLRLENKAASSHSEALSSLLSSAKDVVGHQNTVSDGVKNILSHSDEKQGISIPDKAESMVTELFAGRLTSVNEVITNYSGVKQSSISRLFGIVVPATVLTVAKADGGDVDEKRLHQLTNQKQQLIEGVPSGINMAAALGLDDLAEIDQEPTVPRVTDTDQQRKPHNVSFVQWILIIVIGLGILTGFYVGCGSNRVGVTMQLPPSPATGNNWTKSH